MSPLRPWHAREHGSFLSNSGIGVMAVCSPGVYPDIYYCPSDIDLTIYQYL